MSTRTIYTCDLCNEETMDYNNYTELQIIRRIDFSNQTDKLHIDTGHVPITEVLVCKKCAMARLGLELEPPIRVVIAKKTFIQRVFDVLMPRHA